DVSPRNIFVTYHGVVKLLDFGVVRGPEKQKSIPGVFKGKYGYCAPEQLEGKPVDRRTDVFCLGIALWECLTGARLFDAASDVAQTLERLLALNAIRPADADAAGRELTGTTNGSAPAQPRAMWSTSLGSHPSGARASEPSFTSTSPSGGSLSGGPPSGRTPPARSSSGGRAALPTPVSPARAAARRAVIDALDSRPSGPGARTATRLPIGFGVVLVLG